MFGGIEMKCMFQDCPFDATKTVPCEIGITGEHMDVHVCEFHYGILMKKEPMVSMEIAVRLPVEE